MAPRHRLLTFSPWHGRNSAPGELSPLCADTESGGGTGAHWGTIVGAQNAHAVAGILSPLHACGVKLGMSGVLDFPQMPSDCGRYAKQGLWLCGGTT